VKIAIVAGNYKEQLYLNYNDHQSNVVSIERWGSGDVEIVGYRLQTGWTLYSGNIYTRQWYKNWGWIANPWSPNASEIDGTAMLRREFIEYDGTMLEEVFSIADITAGTFYIDEADNKVYMHTPDGSAPASGKSFVSEYPTSDKSGFQIAYTSNVQLKNLQIKYYACALQHGNLRINDCDNIRLDNIRVLKGAGSGINLVRNNDITLYRCFVNDNGQLGGSFKECSNLLVDSCYFERNNVRGSWINYSGWYLGGCKIGDCSIVTVMDSVFRNNKTNGLWFDVGCTDVYADNILCKNNVLEGDNAGLWVEISTGPTKVVNSTMEGSSYGVYISNANDVFVSGCALQENTDLQLAVRNVSSRTPLITNIWFHENTVEKTTSDGYLVGTPQSIESLYYTGALMSGNFTYNAYYHVDGDNQWEDDVSSTTDFTGWKANTGLDEVGSTFTQL
jgi:hypothetical protein